VGLNGVSRAARSRFDYVVVGAGSAGCVLAYRLTEDSRCSVLLVEAGGKDSGLLTRMPLAFLHTIRNPRLNWGYWSEPEAHLSGRRVPLARGRVWGGSSTINGMFYMRGHSRDFDAWRNMGCEGWSYADVLPYFKRMETSWRGAGPYHGGDGPLHVTAIDTEKLLHEPLMQAGLGAGYPVSRDLAGELEEGFARGEITVDPHGRRASSSRAYLHPALRRPNLTVESKALTTRVLVQGGRAVGIEYVQNGEVHRSYAEREVVLSAGAYNSPQILLLSGIGATEELTSLGIKPVCDLPGVGRNLTEHPHTLIQFAATRPVTFLNELRLDRAARHMLQWALRRGGVFATQINSCNVVVRTRPELQQPDIQLMCNPVRMDASLWFPGVSKAKEHSFAVGVVQLHPRCRGSVTLRSADAAAPPRIVLNLFSDAADFEVMRRGIREARRIYRTFPQSELTGREISPGDAVTSDDGLDEFIRRDAGTAQHPVGTCSMGIGPEAVVDPQLRVYGVEGLRLADASIMPTVPGGNTNAPSIMIGEVASDLLLGRRLPPEKVRRNA
jgi:choline dehydrogenase